MVEGGQVNRRRTLKGDEHRTSGCQINRWSRAGGRQVESGWRADGGQVKGRRKEGGRQLEDRRRAEGGEPEGRLRAGQG